MRPGKLAAISVCLITLLAATTWMSAQGTATDGSAPLPGMRHLLYVGSPGTHEAISGQGILVYDVAAGFRFVKRIPTWDLPASQPSDADEVRGMGASAATGMLYLSTGKRLGAFNLMTEKMVWEIGGHFDRHAISPDGKIIYSPGTGAQWNVIDAMTGAIITTVDTPRTKSPHNTAFSPDGTRVYMAGNGSEAVTIADPRTNKVIGSVGPFTHGVKPFTVNGRGTLVFVNTLEMLGFEVGDVKTGKMIHSVPIKGFAMKEGQQSHESPSHGIALSPDEKELWVADGHNNYVHVFDTTVMPPKQIDSIRLRYTPGWDEASTRGGIEHAIGWVTIGLDGKYVFVSTGEVIDRASKKIVATLSDEYGRPVSSEKIVEMVFSRGKAVRASEQLAVGRVTGTGTN